MSRKMSKVVMWITEMLRYSNNEQFWRKTVDFNEKLSDFDEKGQIIDEKSNLYKRGVMWYFCDIWD